MKLDDSPCKYCDKKGCGAYHDICKDNLEWKARKMKEKEVIRKQKAITSMMDEHVVKASERMAKGKR